MCFIFLFKLNIDLYMCFSWFVNVQDVLYDVCVYFYYFSQFWNVIMCDINILFLYFKDDDIVSILFIIGYYVIK